jgi:small subunit ribosomal protein S17
MPRRELHGVVVSDKADKTVVVRVDRRVQHPVYKKYVVRSKKFMAHDEANAFKVGDVVRIRECRPLSRRKRWEVIAGGRDALPDAPAAAASNAAAPAADAPRSE